MNRPELDDREDIPSSIHDHAIANLSFIRATMENAGSFTAVPGKGGMLMGVSAIIAAYFASKQPTGRAWFTVWVIEALVAFVIGGVALRLKIHRTAHSLDSMPFRRFVLAYVPPMLAGAAITALLAAHQWYQPLPGVWLLLYGAAVTAGGAMSVRLIPIMGSLFMLSGVVALLAPTILADWFMAAGFGVLHIIFGFIIARHHGG